MMKNLILIMFSAIGIAQTNPTPFNKIKVTGQTEKPDATRVVVQDATTKEFHWVDKSTIGGGNLTLQQVTNNGNTTINDIIKNYSLGANAIATLAFTSSGLKIGTNSKIRPSNPFALIKSDSLTVNRNFQLPDNSGILLTNNSTDFFVDINSAQKVAGLKQFENGFSIGLDNTNNVKLNYDNKGAFNIQEADIDQFIVGSEFIVLGDYTNNKALRFEYPSLTALRTITWRNQGGTVAFTSDLGNMPTVANSSSLPANGSVPAGTIYYVSSSGSTYINNGSTWLGL